MPATKRSPTAGFASVKLKSPEPTERYVPLFLRLGVYTFLTVFFFQAMDAFFAYDPNQPWPGLLFVLRTFTFLPLHEGGHFLFMFFGRTLYILGGSFWQIMFPFLWFIIAVRQRSHAAPFALFWVGENLMDVSLYIRDAPYRVLPLLGGHKSGHDWYNLLSQWDAMNLAGIIGDYAYFGGVLICIVSIAGGTVWAVVAFVRSARPVPVLVALPARKGIAFDVMLEEELQKNG